jgi:hypothetical protein
MFHKSFLALALGALLLTGCGDVQLVRPVDDTVAPPLTDYPTPGLACTEAGWEHRSAADGTDYCVDSAGRECELAAYLAGQCTLGATLEQAALACAEAGYTYDAATSTCADPAAGTVCPAKLWADGTCDLAVWLGVATFESPSGWQGGVTAEYAAGDTGYLLSASFRDLPALPAGATYVLYLQSPDTDTPPFQVGQLTYDEASDWWTLEYSDTADLTVYTQVSLVELPAGALVLSQGKILAESTWTIE